MLSCKPADGWMRFPSYAYTGIVDVADGAPAVSAIMQLTGDLGARCAAPQVHWQWFLVEDRLTPTLERALNTSSIAADGFLELQSGGGGMLLAGVQYFHVLLQAETKNIMDQATANVSRPSLDSVLRKGLAMAAMSPKFVGDQVPLGGAVSVLPAFHGMSLRTTFAVNTFSWTDEDLSGLEYEFLTFPFEALNGSNGLAADLNIDWDDPDSMRFWTTLGGPLALAQLSVQSWHSWKSSCGISMLNSKLEAIASRLEAIAIGVGSSGFQATLSAFQSLSTGFPPSTSWSSLAGCQGSRCPWWNLCGCIFDASAVLAASSLCFSGLGASWVGSSRRPGVQNAGHVNVADSRLILSSKDSKAEAEKTFEEFKEMRQDYEKMRTRPKPRNGKRVGNEYNQGCLQEDAAEKRIWIQPGDRILTVNGVKTKTTEDVVEIVSKLKEGERAILKFSRQARGPVQVVFPEPADPVVVRGSSKLQDAARVAGHDVIYRCEDGLCGSCWHQRCIETTTASALPSKSATADFVEQVGGVMSAFSGGNEWKPGESWDNTEPLRLRPCPEIYEKFMNPHLGKWQYNAGKYMVTRDKQDRLIYVENEVTGFLEPEDDDDPTNRWLTADLAEHGQIRIRLSKSLGISIDMESQYKPKGAARTQLLQAVRAISIIADPAVKIKTCSTDFFGTVTCDQIPSAEVVRPALRALNAAAPFVRDGDTLGKMGAALEGMIQVAFEPSIETVDVTSIFGDSLNPGVSAQFNSIKQHRVQLASGNRSEDENLTEELVEPPEPVFVNVSRIQVLPEFLVSISRALTTAQQAMLAEQALGSARGLDGFAAHQVWSSLVALQSAIQGTMNVDRNLPQEAE
eukprot:g12780.t1